MQPGKIQETRVLYNVENSNGLFQQFEFQLMAFHLLTLLYEPPLFMLASRTRRSG
jgi:hypothetical protein